MQRFPPKNINDSGSVSRGSSPLSQRQEAAHGGEGWLPRSATLYEELGDVWGDVGVRSESDRLQSVLMRRPGMEIENVIDPAAALWLDRINPDRAREQHDILAAFYREHGISVNYIQECPNDKPNMYFCRDLFAMTPLGAVVSRPASMSRAGEERFVARALADLGAPIVLTVYGSGIFEGADLIIVNDDLAFVGQGIRTNDIGARQVCRLLLDIGIGEIELVQLNYGCGHLDGVLTILGKDLAMLFPTQISYRVWEILKRHGFRTLDLPDLNEATTGMAINMVALDDSVVLMPAGNPNTRYLLERQGVTCFEVDVSELMKGGGAVHCMTGVLARQPSG